MRLTENSSNWYAGYKRDIQIAQTEISMTLDENECKTLCDVYSAPAGNHQTFYCKMAFENGFTKLIYAKAIQNSIWFSEPIYMYRFEEAKLFCDHPIRKGRILCGKKIIRKSEFDELTEIFAALCAEQPDDTVTPKVDADFTAIRVYENEKPVREILYTEAEKLSFRGETDASQYIEHLKNLHLNIEEIIGRGVC